jgi:hypothetical protein
VGVYFDADISGAGVDDLVGGTQLYYAVLHFSAVGGQVRELEAAAPDHILRAGWVSFGDRLSVIGATARDYWRAVWWLDFVDSFWTPVPTGVGGGTAVLIASRVRWYLAPGCEAHLYVYGA